MYRDTQVKGKHESTTLCNMPKSTQITQQSGALCIYADTFTDSWNMLLLSANSVDPSLSQTELNTSHQINFQLTQR